MTVPPTNARGGSKRNLRSRTCGMSLCATGDGGMLRFMWAGDLIDDAVTGLHAEEWLQGDSYLGLPLTAGLLLAFFKMFLSNSSFSRLRTGGPCRYFFSACL